jgi:hypothetical protein
VSPETTKIKHKKKTNKQKNPTKQQEKGRESLSPG